MAKYYTLDEAAQVLQTSTEEVRKLADDKTVRAFRDRGTLRFRAEEIDELARQRGLGSDPALQFDDLPEPKKGNTPAPKPKGPEDSGMLPFDLEISEDPNDSSVEIGNEKTGKGSSASPKPGSDSDVRLVSDGSDLELEMPGSSDEIPAMQDSGPLKQDSSKNAGDSGVRIVPLDDASDSDISVASEDDDIVPLGEGKKSRGASDSDIRIESVDVGSDADHGLVTEEIDLDEEMKKKEKSPSSGSSGQLPTDSPFELSEDDFGLEKEEKKPSSRAKVTQHAPPPKEDRDAFELTPAGEDDLDDNDEVDLGASHSGDSGDSGINLTGPLDSGISLEKEEGPKTSPNPGIAGAGSGSDSEFELNLDDQGDSSAEIELTPEDSDSEFELTLDDDSSSEFELEVSGEDSSSEFELTLDDAGDSSSEFELTLDDDESDSSEFDLELTAEDSDSEFELTLDEDDTEDDDQDIFATDFEVPALEEESGSEAVALDEEDSDFDLALDDDGLEYEDESGSQVVAIDEDEADDEASTVARPARKRKQKQGLVADEDDFEIDEDDDFADLETDEEEDDELLPAGATAGAPSLPWGPLPAILMFPCVVVVFVVGLMAFEMIQGMWGHKTETPTGGLVVKPLTKAILGDDALPKER